jgi:acyl phosphate:glycerol-3-phosphate acyltransferase
MDSIWIFSAVLVCAYLLGSVSSAILVCRIFRLPDPRQKGSHNPGATNVYRLGGALPALLTLFGDALKGVLAVILARALAFTPLEQGFAAMAAILGHMLPIFFQLRGGKGVATCLGAGLVLAWQTTLALTGIWIVIATCFRISSVASLATALSAPIIAYYLNPVYWQVFLIIGMMIIVRHHENIANLVRGKERRLGRKRPKPGGFSDT